MALAGQPLAHYRPQTIALQKSIIPLQIKVLYQTGITALPDTTLMGKYNTAT